MRRSNLILIVSIVLIFVTACAKTYKRKPLPFKTPTAYPNATEVAGALVGAEAYVDPQATKEAFGFDIRGAGMLPVQVVFDNQGPHPLEIDVTQTFLEDEEGNLWPILDREIAYERATKYSKTQQIFKEGAYGGFLGATAGALIGAAVGIVIGENVGIAAGKGAAVGAAAGATLGGAKGYTSDDARKAIVNDLNRKSLENKPVEPKALAYGFLFFPGEARTAKQLRLKLVEADTEAAHILKLNL
jgi:uncharacterized membrane protein